MEGARTGQLAALPDNLPDLRGRGDLGLVWTSSGPMSLRGNRRAFGRLALHLYTLASATISGYRCPMKVRRAR